MIGRNKMVEWSSFPIISIIYRIYSYFKKYFDLSEREKTLIAKEEQLKNEEGELNKLRTISNENSKNYQSMIDIYPSNLYVIAYDDLPSPHLEFQINFTNRSIFDYKTKHFFMRVLSRDESSEIGQIEISREINLPHQQIASTGFKVTLHPNFVNKLKLLKKECKSLQIQLLDIKIDLSGDKEFYRGGTFNLKMPYEEINVT